MTSSDPDPATAETPRDEHSQEPQGPQDQQAEQSHEEDTEDPKPEPAGVDPAPVPVRRAGPVGPLLCLGAAVLTVIGSFLELLTAENFPAPGSEQSITFTAWTADLGGGDPGTQQPIPLNGVPLMVAAAFLLVAAAFWILVANRPSLPRLARARSLPMVVTGAAAAFLAGTVATIGMQVWWWLQLFEPPELAPATSATVNVGTGYWTLVIAAVLAIGAALLSWRQRREVAEPVPAVAQAATPAEEETPVLVRRLPDAPPEDPPATQGS